MGSSSVMPVTSRESSSGRGTPREGAASGASARDLTGAPPSRRHPTYKLVLLLWCTFHAFTSGSRDRCLFVSCLTAGGTIELLTIMPIQTLTRVGVRGGAPPSPAPRPHLAVEHGSVARALAPELDDRLGG